MSNNMKTAWILGAGYMGSEYAKVLAAQGIEFITIGRGEKSAAAFSEKTGFPAITGGVERHIDTHDAPQYAIVATTTENLAKSTLLLLEKGVKNILLEKPAGMNCEEIAKISETARKHDAYVQVAYNRRFYLSTLAAEKIITEDGGVISFNFEFTEWSHQLETLNLSKYELPIWFLANSTHVVDLAFYLGGHPVQMNCYTSGSLDWYKPASVFAGAGVSDKGALFSYQANWKAPGRWNVEILTAKHRLIFRPMEQLHVQKIGSVTVDKVEIDNKLDTEFKPGLYLQCESFFSDKHALNAIDIHEHLRNMEFYDKIEQGVK